MKSDTRTECDSRPEIDLHLPQVAMVADSVEAVEAAMRLAARQTVQIDKRASRRLKKVNADGKVTGEVESAAVLKGLLGAIRVAADYQKASPRAEVKAAVKAIKERRKAGLPDLCSRGCGAKLNMDGHAPYMRVAKLKRGVDCFACVSCRKVNSDVTVERAAVAKCCDCGCLLSSDPRAAWVRRKRLTLGYAPRCRPCGRYQAKRAKRESDFSLGHRCFDCGMLLPSSFNAMRERIRKKGSDPNNWTCRSCGIRRVRVGRGYAYQQGPSVWLAASDTRKCHRARCPWASNPNEAKPRAAICAKLARSLRRDAEVSPLPIVKLLAAEPDPARVTRLVAEVELGIVAIQAKQKGALKNLMARLKKAKP